MATQLGIVRTTLLSLLLFFLSSQAIISQTVIDQVIAVVGGDMIMQSDIEQELMRMKMQGYISEGDEKCELFEQMLIQKLLLNQAKIDSLSPNTMSIEGEIDRRLKYFISQIGSEKALENYFNKSIYEIKDDLREMIEEQQLTQQMRQKIIDKVAITPSEVKSFYRKIPTDSLPMIPDQYQLRQIVIYPPASAEAKFQVKEKLLELRNRILQGDRFATLAIAYSEDRGSAVKGGELGFRSRDELVKAFADAAFNLKEGQVSQIVETEYGFHIIQLIQKKDDQVNVRHILMKPQYSSNMLAQATAKLDSIVGLIKADSMKFEEACFRFSEDKKSNLSGGLVVNPQTNTALFQKDQLQPSDFYVIKNLKPGEISAPFESRDEHANVVFKVVELKAFYPSHRANIKDDYDVIQNLAKSSRENEILMQWVADKQKTTYIRIEPSYKDCQFQSKGWIK
jgi:peptidyl-prolyl cis-trans isomerase SurA